jgi:uncharacterized protein YrrD
MDFLTRADLGSLLPWGAYPNGRQGVVTHTGFMRIRSSVLGGTLAMYGLAAALAWAQAHASTNSSSEIRRASFLHFRGMAVENTDAEQLGTLRNVIVDLQTGEVVYGIVATGGFLGVRSTRKIVPATALSSATTKRRTLALDVSVARWKRAPNVQRNLLKLAEPARGQELRAYYGILPREARLAQANGRGAPAPQPPSHLQLATDLLGQEIIGQRDQPMGRISDLLVDFSGHKSVFALIHAKFLNGSQSYAVPLRDLTAAGTKMRVDITRAAVQAAPLFTIEGWGGIGQKPGAIAAFRTE